MKKKIKLNKKQLTIIFSVITAFLLCLIAVMGYGIFRLSRMNMYSKNISLDNNYFLADVYYEEGMDTDGNYEETYSGSSEVAAVEIDAYEEYSNYFYQQIEDLYYSGVMSSNQFDKIIEKAETDGYSVAARYANELLGAEYFYVIDYVHIIDVPYISQVGILPNGCEAVSATMLLHYNGYDIDPVDFVDNYVDTGEVYVKRGCRYGPNPKTQYAGDPKSEKGGWGCFAPVIIKALNKYLDGKMYAKNLTRMSLEELVQQYIAIDIPVAVWVTQGMEDIKSLYQWQSYDKSETFLYPVSEHCMVLVGFDDKYYYFNDPLDENKTVKYEKSVASASYNSLGKQAVAIIEEI